jgi:hypothetical protein
MELQEINHSASSIWSLPYDSGTGARRTPFKAPRREYTSVNASSYLQEWLALSETKWIFDYDENISSEPNHESHSLLTYSSRESLIPKRIELRSEIHSEPVVTTTEDQITLILSVLSLRVTELASVMDVQRPTIYSWLQGEFLPQHDKKIRLGSIYELAAKWRSLSTSSLGKAVRDAEFEGTNILSLLKQKKIDHKKVIRCFEGLVASTKQSPRNVRRKGLVADALRRRGIDPTQVKSNNAELNAISGRRFDED